MDRLRGYLDREGPLRPSTSVILISAALTLLGVVMIGSVSTGPETTAADPYAFTVKQMMFAGLGILIAFIVSRVPLSFVMSQERTVTRLTWALLVAVLAIGSVQLGAKRWIAVGPFHIQPSEVAKITIILITAKWAATRADNLSDYRRGFLLGFLAVGFTCLLVILEKDMGTTLFLFALGAGCMWAGGARFLHLAGTSAAFLGTLGVVAWAMGNFDYVVRRLDGYASGSGTANDQVAAGLDALRTGGVFGTGLGEGSAHLGFVPKIHNDFIVAAVGEQLGLVGVLLLVSGYVFLFHAGWRIAESAKNRASYVIAFGVSLCIAMQAIFNLCVATGLVPPKGINLPFVSYGGSSLLVLGAAVGLLLAVARENDAPATVPAAELDELGMVDDRATGPTSLGGAAS